MARHRWRLKKGFLSSGIIILAVITLVVLRLTEEVGRDVGPSDRFIVVRVLDGDTVELAGGDRLRLLAVDTPEEGEPLHDEARQFLERLVLGKPVRIEHAGERRDRYGRLLGYLYIEDTLLVNRAIIANGLGYLYLFKDSRVNSPEIRSMLAAQRRAVADNIGLAALTFEPETHYVASPNGFRFHRPGCRSLTSKEPGHYREISTREEALRDGLSPCRNCKP
jgi:micrococcal nuclease